MSDEKAHILPSYGPWSGQIIAIPAEDAQQAIADGWARDPYATPDQGKDAPPLDEKRRGKAMEAAEAYARKLRGEEPAAEAAPAAPAKRASTAKEPEAGDTARYETRQAKAKE